MQRKHRDRLQSYASQPHNLKLEEAKCQQEMQVRYTFDMLLYNRVSDNLQRIVVIVVHGNCSGCF